MQYHSGWNLGVSGCSLHKPFEKNYSLLNLKAPGTKRELPNLHSTFLHTKRRNKLMALKAVLGQDMRQEKCKCTVLMLEVPVCRRLATDGRTQHKRTVTLKA